MTPPLAGISHCLQISKGSRASGVGTRQRRPLRELLNQRQIDALAQSFHIDRVHQELITPGGKLLECCGCESELSKFLPAICDDEVFFGSFPAAQIKDQTLPSNILRNLFKPIPIDVAFTKYPRRDDDVRSAVLQ